MHRASLHLRVLPATRSECVDGARPCPLVSCRFHLLLNVTSDGRLYSQRPFDEDSPQSIAGALEAMPDTCALDVAGRGGEGERDMGSALPLGEVGRMLGISSAPKIMDIEREALEKVAVLLADDHPDDPYFRIQLRWELKKK